MKARREDHSLTSLSHRPHTPLLQTRILGISGSKGNRVHSTVTSLLLTDRGATDKIRHRNIQFPISTKDDRANPRQTQITEQRKQPQIVQICQTFQGCTRNVRANDSIHIHQDHYPYDR